VDGAPEVNIFRYFNIAHAEHFSRSLDEKDTDYPTALYDTIQFCRYYLNSLELRLLYGERICKNRLIEGEFINKSLKEIRSDLSKIIRNKNKSSSYTIPNYPGNCSEYYKQICREHCFDATHRSPLSNGEEDNEGKSDLNLKSKIMLDILETLKQGKEGEVYTQENFYEDLLVSIFCLMNVSKNVVDPPPSPYIDINNLKIHFVAISIENKTYLDGEWRKYGSGGPQKQNAQGPFPDYNHVCGLINCIKDTEDLIKYYNTENEADTSITPVLKDDPDRITVNELMERWEQEAFPLPNLLVYKKTPHHYHQIWEKLLDNNMFFAIRKYIEAIDNHNAASTMGTLDFLDATSKFYLTELPCKPLDIKDDSIVSGADAPQDFDSLKEALKTKSVGVTWREADKRS
tara:strand:+ start:34 stop:1239 length:1206 start_codon:yes stop_codon:yes gene_type:complete